ncbi:MAG: sulfite exporter TauE/SafE family protein [Nitrospinota bacterium]
MESITLMSGMNSVYIISQLLIGLTLGTLIGMTGIGAGILIMPALLFVSQIEPSMAIGTALLLEMFTKLFGSFAHWKLGNVDKETSFYFSLGSIPGVLAISFLINTLKKIIPEDEFNLYIKIIVAVMLCVVCIYLIWDSFKKNQRTVFRSNDPLTGIQKAKGTVLGGVVGATVSATSIGAGVFMIPVLTGVFKLSAQRAVGSSILISVIITLVGSGVYLFYGNINVVVAILLMIGTLPGVRIGSKISHKLPEIVLRRLITGLAVFSFISMLVSIKN